jgi:hypothetical protein
MGDLPSDHQEKLSKLRMAYIKLSRCDPGTPEMDGFLNDVKLSVKSCVEAGVSTVVIMELISSIERENR